MMGQRANVRRGVLWGALMVWLTSDVVQAIWLNLPGTGTKCVSEEIHNNVVVLGDYVLVHGDHTLPIRTISVKVISPYGTYLHHQENVTHGQFAFTTSEAGNYMACFWVDAHHPVSEDLSVNLEWKIGIAAKDWDSVAKKENLVGIELELVKLEGAVDAIHENLLYLKNREAEMRSMSETTNERVAWFSIMSLGICIIVSVLQLLHLKKFFQKKKLI